MKRIDLHHPYNKKLIPIEEVVLVLGFFDGVHRGHQKVIQTAKEKAEEMGTKLALMTFNQHPSIVFQKVADPMKYLTTLADKEAHIEKLGVDYLYVVDFTSAFANLSPASFVENYMVDLHSKLVIAGFDYSYGKNGAGKMSDLAGYAKERFEVLAVPCQEEQGEKISSTAIRHALDSGELEKANHLLGYVYETEGTVVHGDARGRTLGFPTANIQIQEGVRLPKIGVYAVELSVSDHWYPAMAQIGYDVTFGSGRDMTVEVYILNFNQDIYGEAVSIRWHHFFRNEIKFDGIDSLIAQLKQDEANTDRYFEEKNKKK